MFVDLLFFLLSPQNSLWRDLIKINKHELWHALSCHVPCFEWNIRLIIRCSIGCVVATLTWPNVHLPQMANLSQNFFYKLAGLVNDTICQQANKLRATVASVFCFYLCIYTWSKIILAFDMFFFCLFASCLILWCIIKVESLLFSWILLYFYLNCCSNQTIIVSMRVLHWNVLHVSVRMEVWGLVFE